MQHRQPVERQLGNSESRKTKRDSVTITGCLLLKLWRQWGDMPEGLEEENLPVNNSTFMQKLSFRNEGEINMFLCKD